MMRDFSVLNTQPSKDFSILQQNAGVKHPDESVRSKGSTDAPFRGVSNYFPLPPAGANHPLGVQRDGKLSKPQLVRKISTTLPHHPIFPARQQPSPPAVVSSTPPSDQLWDTLEGSGQFPMGNWSSPSLSVAGTQRSNSFSPPTFVSSTSGHHLSEGLLQRISKTKLCVHHLHGRCARGTHCAFAHSMDELRSPPDLYKTRLCINYVNNMACPKGELCRFAHGDNELRRSELAGAEGKAMAQYDSNSSNTESPNLLSTASPLSLRSPSTPSHSRSKLRGPTDKGFERSDEVNVFKWLLELPEESKHNAVCFLVRHLANSSSIDRCASEASMTTRSDSISLRPLSQRRPSRGDNLDTANHLRSNLQKGKDVTSPEIPSKIHEDLLSVLNREPFKNMTALQLKSEIENLTNLASREDVYTQEDAAALTSLKLTSLPPPAMHQSKEEANQGWVNPTHLFHPKDDLSRKYNSASDVLNRLDPHTLQNQEFERLYADLSDRSESANSGDVYDSLSRNVKALKDREQYYESVETLSRLMDNIKNLGMTSPMRNLPCTSPILHPFGDSSDLLSLKANTDESSKKDTMPSVSGNLFTVLESLKS